MRARTGKIARLPGNVRDELNRRLYDGALGKELAPWLNALPEVQRVLAERFAGRPITEDNLSEWRRGGFQDWRIEQERRDRLRELTADYHNCNPEQNARRLGAHLHEHLALKLAEELERLSQIEDSAERIQCFRRISQEVCRLQNSHNRARELRLLETKAARQITRPVVGESH